MRKNVVRDKDGKVLNIGTWDEKRQPIYAMEDVFGLEQVDHPTLKDERGHPVTYPRPIKIGTRMVEPPQIIGYSEPTNPLPEGATEAEEEVTEGWDGGLYHADDLRKDGKRRVASEFDEIVQRLAAIESKQLEIAGRTEAAEQKVKG